MNKNELKNYIPIVYNNNFSYIEYKKIIDKYLDKDSRELNFQNRVIIPMLEKLLINTDIEVVDTSTLYYRGKMNSKTINNSKFTGKQSNGKYSAPPDLLLVKNWNINNVNNTVNYIAAIEIKYPNSPHEHIHGKNFEEYNQHVKDEMNAHLSVNNIVILTDCYRWQFFNKADGFIYSEPIDLVDENNNWKSCVDGWNQLQKKLLSVLK